MPTTGDWQNWTTIATPNIALSAGVHVLTLSIDSGPQGMGNFNYLTLSAAQTRTNSPFNGQAQSIPGTLQFENYDLGGEGAAYHDTSAANEGGQFRADSVDLGTANDSGGGYFLGWTNPGEWEKYTVNVGVTSAYSLTLRVANGGAGGSFHLSVDGSNVTGSINMPGTGGWQNWTTISLPNVSLSAGSHVLTLTIDSGALGMGNFNYLTFSQAQSGPPATNTPYLGQAQAVPGTLNFEKYDSGGEGVAYHDTSAANEGGQFRGDGVDLGAASDTGGGYFVGWANPGEWVKYTVNVASTDVYSPTIRIANGGAGGTFHINVDGNNATGSISMPGTGGWQNWTTLSLPNISISAGIHVLTLAIDSGAQGMGNFNWMTLIASKGDWSQPLVWSSLADAPVQVAEAQSVTLNGKLYVFGGYDVTTPAYEPTNAASVYDPTSNAWKSIASMPAAETHMGVATDGTYIYVAGGYTYDPATTFQTFGTTNVFRYDPNHNTWSTYTPLPAPRAAGALVFLNGQLHFFDGVDPTRIGKTDHWTLSVSAASPVWTTAASLPFSRNHMAGVILNGKIYAVGGQSTDDDSSTTADVLVWDPANPSSWTAVASMPTPRSHAVVVAIDGRIVVAGGTVANDVPLSSVISYDPTTNAWSNLTSLPAARLAPVGGAIGDQIIVASGFGDNQLQSDAWAATV
jgi:N-acetylneuraminic acid mutarotase